MAHADIDKRRRHNLKRYHRSVSRGDVSEVRQAPARARAQHLRILWREGQGCRARPRRAVPGRGEAAARSRSQAPCRTRTRPPAARRTPGRRPLRQVRPDSGAPGAYTVRALRRTASRRRPRPPRQGEGRGLSLRRTRSRGQAPAERERSRLRRDAAGRPGGRAAGLCIRCGTRPPEEGRPMCEPCRDGRGSPNARAEPTAAPPASA